MFKRTLTSVIPLLGLNLMLAGSASATVDAIFNDFSDTTVLTLNGSAKVVNTIDGNVLRLTPAQSSQSGSAFSYQTVNASDFSSFFKFRITNPGGTIFDCNTQAGADGLVFVIQSVSDSIGGGGQGIGYAGIDNSVGVEFDSWCNASNQDPSSNHLGIVSGGSVVHATDQSDVISITPDFDDGNIWYAWVDYNGSTLEVRVNQTGIRPNTPTLSKQIDIPALLGNVQNAYVGFTSGTGADWGDHDIISWEYRDQFNPISSVPQNCAATYTSDGKLKIPYVSVPNALGGTSLWEVEMQLLPITSNAMDFRLTGATQK
ncbi:MAG: L-type lectin-domain containing protein [Methylomonas sp.]|nr:L-type lectin-domain containing protein [Methylomonas sp.]